MIYRRVKDKEQIASIPVYVWNHHEEYNKQTTNNYELWLENLTKIRQKKLRFWIGVIPKKLGIWPKFKMSEKSR